MTTYPSMSFLVSPSNDPKIGYTAAALQKGSDGALEMVEPRQIGAGATPIAALLRCITPIREKDATYQERRQALRNITTRRGTNIRDLATRVPFTRAQLTDILNGEYSPYEDALVEIQEAAHISLDDYRREIRAVQRESDRSKDVLP